MKLHVPYIDLKQRFIDEKKHLLNIIENTLKKGTLVLTSELNDFERKISKFSGIKYGIGLNSGTDALMMGLMALGIKKGDEVITSPISFVATVGSIVHVGARPVFVDVRDDFLINPDLIEKAITKNTKAIMPVHWTGDVCEMDRIVEISLKYNIPIIEDAAQSMGSYYKNRHAGTFGTVGAISFHPLKNLNGLGDGGMLLTNNEEIANKVNQYRNHGLVSRDHVEEFGVNSRLDVLHAEVLNFRMDKLSWVIEQRAKNIRYYKKNICSKHVQILDDKQEVKPSHVMFLIKSPFRDQLKQFLNDRGIETLIYYGTPLHLHPASKKLGYKTGDFKIAEKLAKSVLALPHHQYLKKKQLKYVVDNINEFKIEEE